MILFGKGTEKWIGIERKYHLGSAQNEALSSSGTIRVTFRYLAIVTISQICHNKKRRKSVTLRLKF
jgi:hypothetical protein